MRWNLTVQSLKATKVNTVELDVILSHWLLNCPPGEANLVVHHVKQLLTAGVPASSIAVIAPYTLQVIHYNHTLEYTLLTTHQSLY